MLETPLTTCLIGQEKILFSVGFVSALLCNNME